MLFVATAVRQWIPRYRRYVEACRAAAGRVNDRFPGNPIQLELATDAHSNDHARALAALGMAHIVFVGSTYDGLNLVAIEAALVGESALVLSENAGVHEDVGALSWSFNPFDIAQAADQLGGALAQPVGERVHEALERRRIVCSRSPRSWVAARSEAARQGA
jgi:trehalose 6-phosphate synthase